MLPAPLAPLYQKHERGAHLCVWLEEFLENDYQALPGILLGFYQETGILLGF